MQSNTENSHDDELKFINVSTRLSHYCLAENSKFQGFLRLQSHSIILSIKAD